MESIKTLAMILTPMLLGFLIRIPKPYVRILDKVLGILVYLLLLLIGISLAQVENLLAQVDTIARYVLSLFALLMTLNVASLWLFERLLPWTHQVAAQKETRKMRLWGSMQQPVAVLLGLLLGKMLPETWLPHHQSGTYALMLLVFLVGIQLRSNGIGWRQLLLNKRGLQVSLVFIVSCCAAGLLFAALFDEVSWHQGLALSSGYGWYSLSGIVMTQAYGATWGSVALLNDLLREFFALALIPLLMRQSPATAVGVGGATSLDFTLPVIQSSGGLAVVPLAIGFGFIINVVSPFLMLLFSTLGK